MGILTYNEKTFLMDGKPYTILSGAMHYFRIPREYWHDRLLKLKEIGFNTVETYTAWNLHEREEGVFDFTGMLDVAAYVDEAAALGLNVILRPGPYICSEWEFGGLPRGSSATTTWRSGAPIRSSSRRSGGTITPSSTSCARALPQTAGTSSWCRSRTNTAPTATTRST